MANKSSSPEANSGAVCPRANRVGGQAVLEGVMMKSGDNVALSVRKDDGSIETETKTFISARKKYKIANVPILRGVINMYETFKLSYSILGRSAEMLGIDEVDEESKFDRWLREKFGDKLMNVIMSVAMVLGVALALVLFSFIPTLIAKWIGCLISGTSLSDLFANGFFKGLWGLFKLKLDLPYGQRFIVGMIQGLIKIAIFVGYMLLVSLMKDIKRTFQYHGAEHKSIACFEAGEELTPENAKKHTRFHPRCGTSFIFVTLILTILVFSPLPLNNVAVRMGLQFLFLPLVIGLSFEFIMYAGKHQNALTAILSAPGLWMQRITTKEPSLDQLEVALTSLKAAMPEDFPELAAKLAEAQAEKAAKDGEADGEDDDAPEGEAAEGGDEAPAPDDATDGDSTATDSHTVDNAPATDAPTDGDSTATDAPTVDNAPATDSHTI